MTLRVALRTICAFALLGPLVHDVSAALIIESSAPPGMPLNVVRGDTSQPLLLSAFSDSTPPQAEEPLTGWQLTFKIVPDAGASGELTFESAALPASNYVLAAAMNDGLATIPATVPNALNMLTAFDFTAGNGVQVPSDPGAGLLELQFLASPDAQGTFGLFIAGGPGLTEWSDQTPRVHEFVNVATSGLTRIASIRAVPEPASCTLALVLAALMPLTCWRR